MVNSFGAAFFLVAVLFSNAWANEAKSQGPSEKIRNPIYEAAIKSVLEGLRTNPAIFPSISLDPIDTTIEVGFTKLRLTFDHGEVIGIPAFTIESVEYQTVIGNPDTLTIALSFPEVVVTGPKYSVKGVLAGVLPLDGGGPFMIKMSKANLVGNGNVKILELTVYNLEAGITFDTFEFEFVNFIGSLSDEFNKMMTEIGKDVLTELKPQLDGVLSRYLENLINRVLGGGGGGAASLLGGGGGAASLIDDRQLGVEINRLLADALEQIIRETVEAIERQELPEYY